MLGIQHFKMSPVNRAWASSSVHGVVAVFLSRGGADGRHQMKMSQLICFSALCSRSPRPSRCSPLRRHSQTVRDPPQFKLDARQFPSSGDTPLKCHSASDEQTRSAVSRSDFFTRKNTTSLRQISSMNKWCIRQRKKFCFLGDLMIQMKFDFTETWGVFH